jgi:hypothetical protein
MTVTVFTEAQHPGAFIVSEEEGFLSRDAVTINESQTVLVGQVLGRSVVIADATSSAAADASNTGSSGAMTLDATTPVLAGAKNGKYRVVCIEPGTNVGTFAVFDPYGVEIGKYVVGGADFAKEIKFAIADATDFVAGDAFTVTVGIESLTDELWEVLDPTATDGTQIAAGIAVYGVVTGAGETKKISAITRIAEVRAADLAWPAGISAANKARAIEELRAINIILR